METWKLHSQNLKIRKYDAIRIIYQIEPGKTHFLNATTTLILETLKEKPCTILEVCQILAGRVADCISNDEIQLITAHMARLDALGLVSHSSTIAETR